MLKLLWKWLDVYEDEVTLFLWAAFLLFIIHVGNLLFTNTLWETPSRQSAQRP